MILCIFCGGHTKKDEAPIPISILEFQPPADHSGEHSVDRFTAKFCCQSCYRKIHENIANAACESARSIP